MTETKERIRQMALETGFDSVGFARASTDPKDLAGLREFLDNDWQGDMDWMDNANGRRGVPEALMPEVKSIITLGTNYGPSHDPMEIMSHKHLGAISVYAQGKDYHDLVKKRLKKLGRWMVESWGNEIKVFVDTAPVMEKPLASRSGIGWQGKHSNVVSRQFGSWMFLGEIFTTLDLPADPVETDHCGSCTKCLSSCPTDAFPKPYQLQATRCISYLTIEHKGMIEPELMENMGNHIYGCDDCLSACPWNKFAAPSQDTNYFPRAELSAPRLAELAQLDDADFRQVFSGSPIKRTGRNRFVRNVLIAIGNSGDQGLKDTAEALLSDESEVVKETAKWAIAKLSKT